MGSLSLVGGWTCKAEVEIRNVFQAPHQGVPLVLANTKSRRKREFPVRDGLGRKATRKGEKFQETIFKYLVGK
jgi:hypothetical protein